MKLAQLDAFAADHHGLVTLAACRRVGIADATWYRAIADGRFEPLFPGVARMYGSAVTREQRLAAAVLASGAGALASHRSAAMLWGVPRPDDDPPELILVERNRQATLAGVVVHRPRDRRDLNPARRHGIATTNVLRMLCDLGAVDPGGVVAAVGHVVTSQLASPAALYSAIRMHSRQGRRGVPALRKALEEWVIDGRALDSELERRMRSLSKQHHLPRWEFHARILGYEVDFWFIDTPIVLECDGWEFHDKRRERYELDRRRDAELAAAGYIAVRFTYRMLTSQPKWVVAMIRNALLRWAPTGTRRDLGGRGLGFERPAAQINV